MPPMTGKSGLMGKLGNRLAAAHEQAKGEETKYGQMDLPPGVQGVAQLVDAKFDVHKDGDHKGEYFFYAAGVVKVPAEHNGVPVEGLRTSITEPIYDTPNRTRKTLEEHVAWVYNELRKLGVDTKGISPANLEAVCDALKQQKPHFRFRTYRIEKKKPGDKGYNPQYDGPNAREPMTNHQWNGVVKYDPAAGSNGDGVVDQTGGGADELPPDDGSHSLEGSAGNNGSVEPAPSLPLDLDALAEAAAGDGPDTEAAGEQLIKIAQAAGIVEQTARDATTWQAVVNMIRAAETKKSAPAGSPARPSAAPKPWVPVVGDAYFYKPFNKKTKKKEAKAVEVEVKAVYADKKTFDLLNMDDKTTEYKNVSWDDLEKD